METNNWRKKAKEILSNHIDWTESGRLDDEFKIHDVLDGCLEVMNLVFEATKKECADKVALKLYDSYSGKILDTCVVDKESILNINKPSL